MHEGHKVLYKQLLAWMLQGHLFDPHQEFFIAEEKEKESGEAKNKTASQTQLAGEGGDGRRRR